MPPAGSALADAGVQARVLPSPSLGLPSSPSSAFPPHPPSASSSPSLSHPSSSPSLGLLSASRTARALPRALGAAGRRLARLGVRRPRYRRGASRARCLLYRRQGQGAPGRPPRSAAQGRQGRHRARAAQVSRRPRMRLLACDCSHATARMRLLACDCSGVPTLEGRSIAALDDCAIAALRDVSHRSAGRSASPTFAGRSDRLCLIASPCPGSRAQPGGGRMDGATTQHGAVGRGRACRRLARAARERRAGRRVGAAAPRRRRRRDRAEIAHLPPDGSFSAAARAEPRARYGLDRHQGVLPCSTLISHLSPAESH